MVWDKSVFRCMHLLTNHVACFPPNCNAVSGAGEYGEEKKIMLFISMPLFSRCENLLLLLVASFRSCSFIWMKVMPTVYFLTLPCEAPVASRISPEVKMDYCRRTACPALYTFHTHRFSIISLIHRGSVAHAHAHSHTHTYIHTSLDVLTGLLAKGQCQESDKSSDLSHPVKLLLLSRWLSISFYLFLFISVSPCFFLYIYRLRRPVREKSSRSDQFPVRYRQQGDLKYQEKTNPGSAVRGLCLDVDRLEGLNLRIQQVYYWLVTVLFSIICCLRFPCLFIF